MDERGREREGVCVCMGGRQLEQRDMMGSMEIEWDYRHKKGQKNNTNGPSSATTTGRDVSDGAMREL